MKNFEIKPKVVLTHTKVPPRRSRSEINNSIADTI